MASVCLLDVGSANSVGAKIMITVRSDIAGNESYVLILLRGGFILFLPRFSLPLLLYFRYLMLRGTSLILSRYGMATVLLIVYV